MPEMLQNISGPSMRNKLTLLALLFSLSTGSIFLLYQFSDQFNHRPNGFIRLFPPHVEVVQRTIDIGSDAWYIAGQTPSHLFLADYNNTSRLLSVGIPDLDSHYQPLKLEDRHEKILAVPKIFVDSPYIFIYEGNTPVSWSGKLNDPELRQDSTAPVPYLNASPATNGQMIITTYSNRLHRTLFAKYILNEKSIQWAPGVLTRQVDGIFCMDGMFRYEPHSARFVFAYYYRNEFLCMDTNLNILYHGKTLDTNSRVKFTVASIPSQEETKISSPPISVTRRICVSSPHIYIQSDLVANNEEKSVFDLSTVIDVYDLYTGKYQLSFHLPEFDHFKIRDFSVDHRTLVALYDHYLLTYLLQF
jgi:hypothetical protein